MAGNGKRGDLGKNSDKNFAAFARLARLNSKMLNFSYILWQLGKIKTEIVCRPWGEVKDRATLPAVY